MLKDQASKFPEYAGKTKTSICAKEIVLDQFKSPSGYGEFVQYQEDYGKQLELIKHQLLDFEENTQV